VSCPCNSSAFNPFPVNFQGGHPVDEKVEQQEKPLLKQRPEMAKIYKNTSAPQYWQAITPFPAKACSPPQLGQVLPPSLEASRE
jgi:hypothetical protein